MAKSVSDGHIPIQSDECVNSIPNKIPLRLSIDLPQMSWTSVVSTDSPFEFSTSSDDLFFHGTRSDFGLTL